MKFKHDYSERGPFAWAAPTPPFFRSARRGREHHGRGFGQSERGSVKYDILATLAERPRHGYEIMLAIEEKRGFRPSPGSIYPALQMLHDGDFVSAGDVNGKRVYTITDSGRELLKEFRESPRGAADDAQDSGPGVDAMLRGMRALRGLKDAVRGIARSGNVDTIGRGVEIIDRARRELYALLADER